MLLRILDINVRPERLDDWFRFTRDHGFPAMLRQEGCRAIWRLQKTGADAHAFQVMTLWDSRDALERFRASPALPALSAAAAPLTTPSPGETLYEVIEDPRD